METRRDFLKKAAMLSGAAGIAGVLPPSIQRALAINPAAGSTFLDAAHVVILMQENRSFDHCYGTLQGVRGFDDPRVISLPNRNPVWLQPNDAGETYAPFRLNMKDTKATWMGSLPHGWTDQVDARNGGRYDRWLTAKRSGHDDYKTMPLTLGYYNREDLPFYYSLADAFTVCDQNFCSSLTGTTPNRLYLWTGTVRDKDGIPAVRNEEVDYGVPAAWTTFPERLEEHGISWKIYQNELSVGVGFDGDHDAWLSNFTDNPIEFFAQYHVTHHPAYIKSLPVQISDLTKRIAEAEAKLSAITDDEARRHMAQRIGYGKQRLASLQRDQQTLTPEAIAAVSAREKSIHAKAFVTNANDPQYHELTTLTYHDGTSQRTVKVPKGDVLHQFRDDVNKGALPAVSWLVAPENFSDHPGAPWYGAWYVSEALDILTKNPEVWKKTIFILCYDENDGYFDHVPPFVPPHPDKVESGKTSANVDTRAEYVMLDQELTRKPAADARESAIGLGYRVPLVIASPWSRGGAVCSQVFDHTSILQFLEKFLSHKTGKKITEPNISAWRRMVCGDLTSVFTPYHGDKIAMPSFVKREPFIEGVHQAQFKEVPNGYRALSDADIAEARQGRMGSYMPRQEKGSRASRALPYELSAHGELTKDKKSFELQLAAGKTLFGEKAAGAPFYVYDASQTYAIRNYAVAAGDQLTDLFALRTGEPYHLTAHGPNGFFRAFRGDDRDPSLRIKLQPGENKKGTTLEVVIANNGTAALAVDLGDRSYQQPSQTKTLKGGEKAVASFDLSKSFGWYDILVRVKGYDVFEQQFAGRVENGKESMTDPLIGK